MPRLSPCLGRYPADCCRGGEALLIVNPRSAASLAADHWLERPMSPAEALLRPALESLHRPALPALLHESTLGHKSPLCCALLPLAPRLVVSVCLEISGSPHFCLRSLAYPGLSPPLLFTLHRDPCDQRASPFPPLKHLQQPFFASLASDEIKFGSGTCAGRPCATAVNAT